MSAPRAFPVALCGHEGMALREYYAGQALAGFCANPAVFASNDKSGWNLVNCGDDMLANYCAILADAMVAAMKRSAS